MDIYEEVLRLKRAGIPCALATIVQCVGSAPQKEGAKMIVKADGTITGTLGGGCLEAEVIEAARSALSEGTPRTIPIQLTEKHGGLVCGGKILVYIEPVVPEPRLVILGAGHVGQRLSTLARFAGFLVTVADDRAEYANSDLLPDADEIVVSDFDKVFSHLAAAGDTFVVVATRGHTHDLEALRAALGTDARYIGLLGSRRKRALLFGILEREGFSAADRARIITPVGLPIGSVTPEEIAVSIMAQIIQQRREGAPGNSGHTPCGGLIAEDGAAQAASSPR